MYHHNTDLQDPKLSAIKLDSGGRLLATTDVGTVPGLWQCHVACLLHIGSNIFNGLPYLIYLNRLRGKQCNGAVKTWNSSGSSIKWHVSAMCMQFSTPFPSYSAKTQSSIYSNLLNDLAKQGKLNQQQIMQVCSWSCLILNHIHIH